MSAKQNAKSDEERKLEGRALVAELARRDSEERASALTGPLERLIFILKNLEITSADSLLGYERAIDWVSIGSDTRLTILYDVNATIVALRERHDLAPFDDGFHARVSGFGRIRDTIFPRNAAPSGAQPGLMIETPSKMRNDDEQ